jgi:CO/xanthine dehydrogenase Mo-binding subunit
MEEQKYYILGKPIPRIDARAKVTGQAKYAADYEMPDMLWGAIKRSPYPHASILNIDTSKAERLPGVKAVITGKDYNGFKWGWSGPTRDEEPLATTRVRYLYEGVAAVAAVDEDTVQEACDLIEVEYKELPGVFTPFEAMKEGAPLVHDDLPGNVTVEYHWNFGDVEKAFVRIPSRPRGWPKDTWRHRPHCPTGRTPITSFISEPKEVRILCTGCFRDYLIYHSVMCG